MDLTIQPLRQEAISALQALWDSQLAPRRGDPLAQVLQDGARGNGSQSVTVWQGGQPVGCAGWVTLGVAQDGCCYCAPLVAADQEVAALLAAHVSQVARAVGATRLRTSVRGGEQHKGAALRAAGFAHLFDFHNFERPTAGVPAADMPPGLEARRFDQVDMSKAHQLYANAFTGVPNAPVMDMAQLREEWAAANMEASRVLVDGNGNCHAFLFIIGNEIDSVGVGPGWRGQGLAAHLYAVAAQVLAAQGHGMMRVLKVASSNRESMRLHQKLGFTESEPAWELFEQVVSGTAPTP